MILVTGHRGFIGSRFLKALGLREFAAVLRNTMYTSEIKGIDIREGKNLLTCELPKDVDMIIHLAAQTSVEASWHDPVHDMDNLRMVARLVKEYPKAKIIYANSCASLNPKSPYGFSKRACSDYLKIFHPDYVSLVFPNIYGGSEQSVVDLFKDKEEVTIYGDGTHVRDYVHVNDIVDGILKAMDWECGEYFLGSGIGTTVLELAEGKKINFAPERKEESEIIVQNTTPNWKAIINVLDYIND